MTYLIRGIGKDLRRGKVLLSRLYYAIIGVSVCLSHLIGLLLAYNSVQMRHYSIGGQTGVLCQQIECWLRYLFQGYRRLEPGCCCGGSFCVAEEEIGSHCPNYEGIVIAWGDRGGLNIDSGQSKDMPKGPCRSRLYNTVNI